jgi:hypothetical protein
MDTLTTTNLNAALDTATDGGITHWGDAAAILALVSAWVGIILLVALVCYVVNALFTAAVYKKANIAPWKAWVPIYSSIKMLQLGGFSGWYLLLVLIPYLGAIAVLVIEYIAIYNIGKKFGKDGAWLVLYIFLPIVWLGIIGYDSSKFSDKKGFQPSVTPEKVPA